MLRKKISCHFMSFVFASCFGESAIAQQLNDQNKAPENSQRQIVPIRGIRETEGIGIPIGPKGITPVIGQNFPSQFVPSNSKIPQAENRPVPDSQEVLSKALDAIGDKNALMQSKNLVTKAKISIGWAGLEGNMTLYQQRDGKALMTVDLPELGVRKIGTDGDIVWQIDPYFGADILVGETAHIVSLQLKMNPLAQYDQLFDETASEGTEKFEHRTDCFVLKSYKSDFAPVFDYFSIENGRHVGRKLSLPTDAGRQELTLRFSEHKTEGTFTLPFLSTSRADGGLYQKIEFTSYKFDTEIDETIFELPAEIESLQRP